MTLSSLLGYREKSLLPAVPASLSLLAPACSSGTQGKPGSCAGLCSMSHSLHRAWGVLSLNLCALLQAAGAAGPLLSHTGLPGARRLSSTGGNICSSLFPISETAKELLFSQIPQEAVVLGCCQCPPAPHLQWLSNPLASFHCH